MREVTVSTQRQDSELATCTLPTANSEQRTANSARRLEFESTTTSNCKQQQASSRYPDPLCGGGGGARVLTLLPVSPPSFPER